MQLALDAVGKPLRGERRNASYLLRVAFCICGEPLYQTTAGNGRRYYRCRSKMTGKPCGNRVIPASYLEAEVDNWITNNPTFEITETRIIHGNDYGKQLAEVGRQIAALTEERFVRGVIRDDYHEVMAQLESEHARLFSMKPKADRTELVGTGRFLSEEWPHWDEATKRRYLADHKFRFEAQRNQAGEIRLYAYPGSEYERKVTERLSTVPHPRPRPGKKSARESG